MNDALPKKSPTQALGFRTYALAHMSVKLDTLDGATDRRLYETAKLSGLRLSQVLPLHKSFIGAVYDRHQGFYETLHLAGPSLIEAYAARCLWEAAGYADRHTREAEVELALRKARRAA